MKRLSLRSAVIFLPLICAAFFAWYTSSLREDRTHALKLIHGTDNRAQLNPKWIIRLFGIDRGIKLLELHASRNSETIFDGERWAQLGRGLFVTQADEGDGCSLFSVGGSTLHLISFPDGTVIQNMRFEGEEIVFTVHGDIVAGTSFFQIPEGESIEFRWIWEPGTSPPTTDLINALHAQLRSETTR